MLGVAVHGLGGVQEVTSLAKCHLGAREPCTVRTCWGSAVPVVLGDAGEGLVPQHHVVLLDVALGDAGDFPDRAESGPGRRRNLLDITFRRCAGYVVPGE